MREQRLFKRKIIDVVTQFKYHDLDDFMSEHLKDISIGGMFIKTSLPKEVGEKIYFRFSLDNGKTLIEGYGKIVWANTDGMGIEFINIDKSSLELIEAMLELKDVIS